MSSRKKPVVEPVADAPKNAFKNDGSFLEMFKRMQEGQQPQHSIVVKTGDASPPFQTEPRSSSSASDAPTAAVKAEPPAKPVPVVAKRRGGRVLPVGVVKKTKKDDIDPDIKASAEERGSAWTQYMTEVRKYKERTCDEETKIRPLVK